MAPWGREGEPSYQDYAAYKALAVILTGLSRGGQAAPTSRPLDFVPAASRNFPGCTARNREELSFLAQLNPAADARLVSRAEIEQKLRVLVMLSWVITFLVIALIAGILGFGGIAGASVEIAKIIFFIAVVLFLVSAVVGLARGRTRV
jgi:uncharacterized membrane protein YtjA (UPF0391 family)